MPIKKELTDKLKEQRKKALAAGGQDKIDKRHEKGQLTARERVERLIDPNTFQEQGLHVEHDCHEFGMESKFLAGDGVITGMGHVDGRPVSVASQDFTVGGGTLGTKHAQKIARAMDNAGDLGTPLVAINDSGGARIQEGVSSLSGYGQVFYRNVYLSGLVPQIAIIAGPCAGGAAYSPALTDFLIMTKTGASMFICGPEVIRAATGEQVTMEEIGSATAHATVSGNIHFVAEDDDHAIAITKKLLSFLPSNNMQDPPHHLNEEIALTSDKSINDILPEDPRRPFDTKKVIEKIVDNGDFLEVQEFWAKNIIVCFGRIDGIVVGFICNQSSFKAGAIDIDASDKAARFIRFCNAFNIPIVNLVDVPGFMPGKQQEAGGIIRHGAKMLSAYSSATVPKITLIMRKAYGGAYLAMCSSDLGADRVYAWPTAEIAVMGAEGAVNILYGKELKSAENADAQRAKYQEEYRERFASPYQAARLGLITDVFEPSETKRVLSLALHNLLSKRISRPPKKHGLIPM
ncbi:MAG: acyl-CoA carboxylase subunit beta [SAR324 cluster bacterium]|nr:acyl-CoA carboxylase subunit beta [SAR324 cluster bacterium]